ncbi:MAG: DUF5302 family protein [Actinobacteria bacterium]|nr:DUF5302 family protein [Actinomycetota bacterium]
MAEKKGKAEEPVDPRAAFLEALEKKKNKGATPHGGAAESGKTGPTKSGPDAARRMFQRRSGSA